MFELPFQRSVQKQARPRAVFSAMNPSRGMGIAAHLAGNQAGPVGLKPSVQIKPAGVHKLAQGGICNFDDGGFADGLVADPSNSITNATPDIMNVYGGQLPQISTQDAQPDMSQPVSNADIQQDTNSPYSFGNLSVASQAQPQQQATGFGGWLQNKHGGITGANWLKAGLTALTGILSGIATKHGAQKPMSMYQGTSFGPSGVLGFAKGGQYLNGEPNMLSCGGEYRNGEPNMMCDGGQYRMADGGAAPMMMQDQQTPAAQDPQSQMIVANAIKALLGQSQNPQQDIQAFIAKFGQQALQALVQQVQQSSGAQQQAPPGGSPGMAGGGILSGPGTGMSDSIPANGGNVQLSNGEYVVPADAVSQLGDGSTQAGAKKLDQGIAALRQRKYGHTRQPAKLHPTENPIFGQK